MVDQQRDREKMKKSPLDDFDNQKFVDDVPLEDLKINLKQEKKKEKSQQTSQSEKEYKADE